MFKNFLDLLALFQADRVTGMPGGPSIDGRIGFLRRNMGRDVGLTHRLLGIRDVRDPYDRPGCGI